MLFGWLFLSFRASVDQILQIKSSDFTNLQANLS